MAPFTQRVQITEFFLQTNLIVLSILLFFVVFQIILKVGQYCVNQNVRFKVQKIRQSKVQKAVRIIYRFIIFPVSLGFFIVLSVALFIDNLAEKKQKGLFQIQFNSFSMLIAWLVLGSVIAIELIDRRSVKRDGKSCQLGGLEGA